jgi:hypothetical protein
MTNPRAERQTLRIGEWPEPHRQAWEEAWRPSVRLKKGGSGSHLAPESLDDYARRYGRFLGFLKRTGRLDPDAPPASQVTPENVEAYILDFEGKINSVTAWNCIYKLRRAAQLLSPKTNFTWLVEIEKDLELMQETRSKLNRFVCAEQIVKAGLTLVVEVKNFTEAPVKRARAIRNGLMIALLAANPTRRKNFAFLEIGKTFRKIEGQWWICISARATKTKTATGRTTDRRLAHPLHRAISRRGSADPSQPSNEGNEQALGVVWWPYIRARCWQTHNPGHSGDPWHSDFAALVSDRWRHDCL